MVSFPHPYDQGSFEGKDNGAVGDDLRYRKCFNRSGC